MKKLLLCILAGAILGCGFSMWFDRNLSSDICFFQEVAEQSDQWAAKMRESGEPCYILAGSSDVRMGLDPEIMLKEGGVRAINAALNASYGQNILSVEALGYARKGDTIVYSPLGTESEPDAIVTRGMKIGFMRHSTGVFEPGIVDWSAGNLGKVVTGDLEALNIWLFHAITSKRHRYNDKTCIVHESGWVELLPVLHSKNMPQSKLKSDTVLQPFLNMVKITTLPDMDTPKDLSVLACKCKERGVGLVLRIPVSYGEEAARARGAWVALQYVKSGYRVLKDPNLGIETDISLMGDNTNHLNAKGARKYSLLLAEQLRTQSYWTEKELVQELERRGWNADGTPRKPDNQSETPAS